MSSHLRHGYFVILFLSLTLTAAVPFSASANNCANSDGLLKTGVSKDSLIKAVPLFGHLTTSVGNLIRIIESGQIMSYQEAKRTNPFAQRGVDRGATDGVYLQNMKSGKPIRTGYTLIGPHILLSSSLLRREDYYYSETWDNYGHFEYELGGSIPAAEATPETLQKSSEFVFNKPIPLEYAFEIWIPEDQKLEWQLRSLTIQGKLRQLGITVHFGNVLPPLEDMTRKSQAIDLIPANDTLNPHPNVEASAPYMLRTPEETVAYLEDPSHWQTRLFKNALYRFQFSPGYIYHTPEIKLRALKVMMLSGNYTIENIKTYLEQPWNEPSLKDQLRASIREFLPAEAADYILMSKEELELPFAGKFREIYQILEYFKKPENQNTAESRRLLYALEMGYFRSQFKEWRREMDLIRLLIQYRFPHSQTVLYPGFLTEEDAAELERLKHVFNYESLS